MAVNQGAVRLHANTRLRDTTTTGGWCATAYVGEHFARESFDEPTTADAVGTFKDLTGRTLDEGGQVWARVYDTAGALVPPMYRIKRTTGSTRDDYKAKRQDADARGFNDINLSHSTNYFLSAEMHWTATPPLGGYVSFGFNLAAPGPAATDTRLDTAAGTFTNGWTVWAGRIDTNAVIRLFKNGVQVGTDTIIALPAAGEVHHVELWIRGTGTAADPTRIMVWHNGKVVINATDAADQYAAQTHVSIGQAGTAGVGSSLEWDNIFIASVPTSPGAIHDYSAVWPELPVAPLAAGAAVKMRMRAAKYMGGGQTMNSVTAQLRSLGATVATGAAHSATSDELRHYNESTLYLTSDGTATGTPRSGGYRIVVQLDGADTLGAAYTIDSEGRETTLPAGTENRHNPGYSVASTTVGVLVPAAKPAFPDAFTVGVRLGAKPWADADLLPALATSQSGVAANGGTPGDSGVGSAWTASNDSVSPSWTADNSYRQADAGVGVAATWAKWATRNNDTPVFFTALPVGYEQTINADRSVTVRSIAEDAFTIDPRLTTTEHLQVDDKVFGTPPTSKSIPGDKRLTYQLGFLAVRYTNARGEGQNGLTFEERLWDIGELVGTEADPIKIRTGLVTQTQGGETGWSPSFLPWENDKPTGTWIAKANVTAPANATGLDPGPAGDVVLVANNPNLQVVVGAGPTNDKKHFVPGAPFLTMLGAFNTRTQKRVEMDADTPKVALLRVSLSTETIQYLEADGVTWTNITDTSTTHFHDMTPNAGDPKVFKKVFTSTTNWGASDILVIGKASVGGSPLSSYDKEISTGPFNVHDIEDVAVKPEDIVAIANAVWDEPTVEARAAGSYGEAVKTRLDAAVSTRATPADLPTDYVKATDARLANLDATVSSRATPDARMANLDAAVSTRATQTSVDALGAPVQTGDTRLANLDAAVSTRATKADVTVQVYSEPVPEGRVS